jgi:hypothetical protein
MSNVDVKGHIREAMVNGKNGFLLEKVSQADAVAVFEQCESLGWLAAPFDLSKALEPTVDLWVTRRYRCGGDCDAVE